MPILYNPSDLEKEISNFYLNNNILVPEDISERFISDLFGVILTYTEKRSFAVEQTNFKMININNQIDRMKQREHFFHELCHILLHCGSQLVMPYSFIELQEFQTKVFVRYASLPYHMIMQYDFENPYLIPTLSNDFKVTEAICRERIEGIHRKRIDTLLTRKTALIANRNFAVR